MKRNETLVKIKFKGKTIEAKHNANIRKILRNAGLTPHNGNAEFLNCKGLGTCGTCAVEIKGEVSPMTKREKWRLNFPPHQLDSNLRLACQCKVLSDLYIQKHDGFWGEKIK